MASSPELTFEEELIEEVRHLPPYKRPLVLAIARAMAERPTAPRGVPGSSLLRFAGTMDRETGEAMKRVVDEDCRRIDPNAW